MNKLGVSGSTIMSDSKKFDELFNYHLEHIEIGEFKNKREFRRFLMLLSDSLLTLGIHSPIIRRHSKYDLVEDNGHPPEFAFRQIEHEAKLCKYLGAKYLLVHFPFFAGQVSKDADTLVEEGLKRLSAIQQEYGIPIVCEPKLGFDRSPDGIKYLCDFPLKIWRKYSLKICIDLGDYVMAIGESATMAQIKKWQKFIHVVHVHNVDYLDGEYYWKPAHPNDEQDGHHKLESIIKYLANLDDITFVLEHTPHMGYDFDYVLDGAVYVEDLVKNDDVF